MSSRKHLSLLESPLWGCTVSSADSVLQSEQQPRVIRSCEAPCVSNCQIGSAGVRHDCSDSHTRSPGLYNITLLSDYNLPDGKHSTLQISQFFVPACVVLLVESGTLFYSYLAVVPAITLTFWTEILVFAILKGPQMHFCFCSSICNKLCIL